jgi:hypothetical protein
MKNSLRIVVPCALLLGFAASAAQAQNFGPPDIREVWGDGARQQIWMNGFGECWHSAYGPPPNPGVCGIPVAMVVPVVAPVVVAPPAVMPPKPVVAAAPAPAPAPYVAPREPRRDRN